MDQEGRHRAAARPLRPRRAHSRAGHQDREAELDGGERQQGRQRQQRRPQGKHWKVARRE